MMLLLALLLSANSGPTPSPSCVPASGVRGGCLTAAAQTIAGPKHFTAPMSIDGGLLVGNGVREDWDGGRAVGEVAAKYFTAYHQHHGLAYLDDGGVGLATTDSEYARSIGSFNCTGVGGDGRGNGQACLTNPNGIVEIYGHTVGPNMTEEQEAYGQTEGLCAVELYDMGAATTRDGGTNVGPILCMAHVGSGDKVWRLMRNGDVLMDGSQLRIRGPRSMISAGPGTTNVGVEVFGNILSGGLRSRAATYVTNQNALTADDDVFQVLDSNNAGYFGVTAQGSVRLGQLENGGELSCPGTGNRNLGQIHYNKTLHKLRVCAPGGWETVTSAP